MPDRALVEAIARTLVLACNDVDDDWPEWTGEAEWILRAMCEGPHFEAMVERAFADPATAMCYGGHFSDDAVRGYIRRILRGALLGGSPE
jgi:imidazolonepropionase-like amidohydrolase